MRQLLLFDRSADTAIRRKKLSAPMAWLVESGNIRPWDDGYLRLDMLDYGCGHGFDADELDMDGYDPNHRPWNVPAGSYDVVTCNYVLNVLDTNEAILDTIKAVQRCLSGAGVAYVTVRADDQNLNGYTSRGTYQRPVRLTGCAKIHEEKGKWRMYVIFRDSNVDVV
jgi:hypothetical protein